MQRRWDAENKSWTNMKYLKYYRKTSTLLHPLQWLALKGKSEMMEQTCLNSAVLYSF